MCDKNLLALCEVDTSVILNGDDANLHYEFHAKGTTSLGSPHSSFIGLKPWMF